MQTYPKAYNSRDEIVHVNDELPRGGPYTCLGCGAPLIAHLKDDKRSRYFAHQSKGKCSGETYLHILAKNVFKQTWHQCRQNSQPFILSLPRRLVCPNRPEEEQTCEIRSLGCTLRDIQWLTNPYKQKRTEYDLAQIYSGVKMEKGDAGFIPDLLLISEDGQKKLYIEIKVKSAVSEEKAATGHKIIEIPIQTEDDIKIIDGCHLSVPQVRAYNFKLDTPVRQVPSNCEMLLIQEQARHRHEARLRGEETALNYARTQRRAKLEEEQSLLLAKRTRMEAEGTSPDTATEWSQDGHPIRILFLREAWILSINRDYRGEFSTFEAAKTRAERIISKARFPVVDDSDPFDV